MKKIIILLILVITTQIVQSQTESKITIGGGLVYGDAINSIGLNTTGQYYVNDQIAVAPSFTYFFAKNVNSIYGNDYNETWMEINIDGNYYPDLNLIQGKLHPYGLAGVNYSIIGYPYYTYDYITNDYNYHNGKEGKIGLNVGAGTSFDIDKSFTPFAQIKYTVINSYGQAQLLVGLRMTL